MAGVAPDDDGAGAEVGGEAGGDAAHQAPVHAVGAGPEGAADAGRAELQALAERLGEGLAVTVGQPPFEGGAGRRIRIVGGPGACVLVERVRNHEACVPCRSVATLTGGARLFDDLPVAVALVDGDGLIRYVNPAAVARYGWRSSETAIGLSAAVLGEGLPERLAGGGPWRGELTATSGEGQFLAAFEVAPFHDEHGERAGSLVVCLDASRRAEAEEAADRLSRLQAVTARLGGAGDVEAVARAVCDHAAAGVRAQTAGLWQLVDEGETFELVRHVGIRPGVEDAFGRFPVDAPLPAGDALRTGSTVVVTGAADRASRYPELAAHPTDYQSAVVVPVLRDGRPLGVLSFGFRSLRQLGSDDHRFLLAVADQTAQALDRIAREEHERSARRRQELLARATGVLAGSLEVEAAATAVARLAVQSFADAFSVHLFEGDELRTVAAVNADPELEELTWAMVDTPPGRRMRSYLVDLLGDGRSMLLPSLDPAAWDELLGDVATAESIRALDVSSAILVGLHSRGRRLGLVAVTRRAGQPPFDQDAFVLVVELAGRLASALDGAQAHHARAEVARTLQASLLPPRLPEIPGVVLAARYDPVGDGSLVGGDFYDVFPVADDRWCLVLGDVCGQGVAAASLTALVRYTVRAAARMWDSPADILRFTNDAILDHDAGDRFCTLIVGMLAPRSGGMALRLAVGGHHLPLHRPAGGEAVPVGRQGTAMGLVPDPEVADVRVELGIGDLLVLTTDGVIEARDQEGRPVADGFLEGLVAEHGAGGAEVLAGAIQRAVLDVGGGRANDDAAALVVEVTGEGRPVEPVARVALPEPFDERYPPEIASVTEARRGVAAWLELQGTPVPRVPDLLLAVTELVTNAVRSARSAVEVRAWLTSDAVMIEVTDDGPGFDPDVARAGRGLDPLADRGRGLFLVVALVDECTIESGAHGTIVRCYVAR